MTKKIFGKRFVAVLTTLAILISMVAMIGSFAVSADTSPYTPKRVFSVTGSGEQVNAKLALNNATIGLTDGEKATIKGYYKIENYVALNSTDSALWLGGGSDAKLIVTGNTDGWVPLELTCTVGSGWIYFEHWYSQGTLSLADIVVEDASGKKYEMATDATATAGDYTVGYSAGSWYGGNYLDKDTAAFHFDPVYVEPYAPKRVFSVTGSGEQVNAKLALNNEIGRAHV